MHLIYLFLTIETLEQSKWEVFSFKNSIILAKNANVNGGCIVKLKIEEKTPSMSNFLSCLWDWKKTILHNNIKNEGKHCVSSNKIQANMKKLIMIITNVGQISIFEHMVLVLSPFKLLIPTWSWCHVLKRLSNQPSHGVGLKTNFYLR